MVCTLILPFLQMEQLRRVQTALHLKKTSGSITTLNEQHSDPVIFTAITIENQKNGSWRETWVGRVSSKKTTNVGFVLMRSLSPKVDYFRGNC